MPGTNVPLPVFSPTGLTTYGEPAILAGVQQDYVQAFALNGKALVTDLTTPQGQLMQSQAYMVAAFQAALAQLVANVDPLTSSGAYQDALGRIYFLTRQPATYATVAASVSGVPGNTLPAGSQVISSDGTVWASQTAVTFAVGTGLASVTFQSQTAGSAPAAGINDLKIYQAVAGWQGVTNAAASTPGVDQETRAQFEARRQASVSIGGKGQPAVIKAAIGQVAGVSDVFVYDNKSDAAITYGATNYPIPAHSIAISVAGGANADVANAIWSKTDNGCGFSTQGVTTVAVQDTVNYSAPYPSYNMSFVRPTTTQVYMTVNVANISGLPANYAPLVQAAVATAFANGFVSTDGTITVPKAKIGSQIVAAEFAAPILVLGGTIVPISIYVSFTPNPTAGNTVTMGIDQLPVCPALNIAVNAV